MKEIPMPSFEVQTNFMGQVKIVDVSGVNHDGVMASPLKMLDVGPFVTEDVSKDVDAQMSAYERELDKKKGA